MISSLLRSGRGAFKSSTVGAAIVFTIALALYEFAIWPYDADRHDLMNLIEQGRSMVFARSALMSGLSAAFVVALVAYSLRAGPLVKIFSFLAFGTMLIIEYAHHGAFDRFSTYSTAVVGIFVGDWEISAKALGIYLNLLCLPPIVGFLLLLISSGRLKPSFKRPWLFGLAMIAFAALTAYSTSNRFVTLSPWAFLRTAVGFPVIELLGRADTAARSAVRPRERIDYNPGQRPTNNIVLIVDESVRGDHLGINGHPSTPVPILSRLLDREQLANYGLAAAGSTCSMASNELLLTGLTSLPDKRLKIYEMPTIFQYARAMGYRTHEFDGQVASVWKGTVADLRFIQHRQNPVHLVNAVRHEYETDEEIARRVKAIVSTSTGNFVWINKRGVHKPYSDNFPSTGVSRSLRDAWKIGYHRRISTTQLVSDYNASIRYNLNRFFHYLFENGSPSEATIYLYTSDHGQSLREGGVQVSHCSISRPEAVVPLFIVGLQIDDLGLDTNYRPTHANIFPTLLDFMGVPRKIVKHPYALPLTEAKALDSERRYYSGPDLTGQDSGTKYPFDLTTSPQRTRTGRSIRGRRAGRRRLCLDLLSRRSGCLVSEPWPPASGRQEAVGMAWLNRLPREHFLSV